MKPAIANTGRNPSPSRAVIARFAPGKPASLAKKNDTPGLVRSTLEQLVLENLDVGIVVSNSRGTITLVNAAAERLGLADPRGKPLKSAPDIWGELFDGSGRRVPGKQWPCMRALDGHTTVGLECRLVHPDGSARNILFGSCPIKEAGSQIDGSFSSLVDVTEQKWQEIRLREDAVLRERARLATDIHDTLMQGVNAVILQLEVLDGELLENLEQGRARLRRIVKMARENLDDARRSMWALSQEPRDEGDPAVTLAFLAQRLFAGLPVQLHLHLQECARLDSQIRVALVRIGNASASSLSPLANATRRPARSPFGKGRVPQLGGPPRLVGMIQIWKIFVGSFSWLYSAWRMPDPADITCTSPATVRPLLPRLSSWLIAPSRT